MNILFLTFISLILFSTKAFAVCPVCTVAVGAGLGFSRWLGIDDFVTGIWVGGFAVSLIVWTNHWLEGKGIKSLTSKILNIGIYYALIFSIYLLPDVVFGFNTLLGIDSLFLGIILGSIGLYTGNVWYEYLKKNNNGHAYFPFQKVVMPVGMLIILTAGFYLICNLSCN